jgi:hypothetical protein
MAEKEVMTLTHEIASRFTAPIRLYVLLMAALVLPVTSVAITERTPSRQERLIYKSGVLFKVSAGKHVRRGTCTRSRAGR